jgi:hypothetical protein
VTTTPNVTLAESVLAAIKDHPERWQQGAWRMDITARGKHKVERIPGRDPLAEDCSTAGCFAGWVALMQRARWVDEDTIKDEDGVRWHVRTYAMRELGLSIESANALFAASNTLEQLEAGVKAMANGRDVRAAVWDAAPEDPEAEDPDALSFEE